MSIKINLDYQATIILTNQFIFDFLLSLTLAISPWSLVATCKGLVNRNYYYYSLCF